MGDVGGWVDSQGAVVVLFFCFFVFKLPGAGWWEMEMVMGVGYGVQTFILALSCMQKLS